MNRYCAYCAHEKTEAREIGLDQQLISNLEKMERFQKKFVVGDKVRRKTRYGRQNNHKTLTVTGFYTLGSIINITFESDGGKVSSCSVAGLKRYEKVKEN